MAERKEYSDTERGSGASSLGYKAPDANSPRGAPYKTDSGGKNDFLLDASTTYSVLNTKLAQKTLHTIPTMAILEKNTGPYLSATSRIPS